MLPHSSFSSLNGERKSLWRRHAEGLPLQPAGKSERRQLPTHWTRYFEK